MKLHKEDDSLEPCKHMESLLNRTADGTAPKLLQWYARYHAAHCGRCCRFLARVTALLLKLRHMKAETAEPAPDEVLAGDRWAAIEASWKEVER